MEREGKDDRKRGLLAGLVLGAVSAFGVLTIGFFGMAIGVLSLLLILWKGPRLVAAGAFATGIGAVWTLLFGRVMVSCAAENAVPGQGCGAGEIGLWVAASAVILAVGLAVSTVAVRRGRD